MDSLGLWLRFPAGSGYDRRPLRVGRLHSLRLSSPVRIGHVLPPEPSDEARLGLASWGSPSLA